MKTVVVLSVMLWYVDMPQPQKTYYKLKEFSSHQICQEYVFENKVELIETLLEEMKLVDGYQLKSFEYFCENKRFNEI